MTKWLVTATKSKVIFRKITKSNRAIAVVYSRLYRTDDELFVSDHTSSDSFVYYDIDEQQPWGQGRWLDPDMTKVLIDSMKMSKGKPTKLFDMNMEAIMAVLVIGIVAFSFLSQYLG